MRSVLCRILRSYKDTPHGPSDWIRTSGLLNPIQADVPQQRHRGTTEKPRLKSREALIRLDFYTLIVPHCRQNYNHFLCEAERKSAQIFEICALFVRFCGKARGGIVPGLYPILSCILIFILADYHKIIEFFKMLVA